MADEPVIISPCPDMGAIVTRHGNGWALPGKCQRGETVTSEVPVGHALSAASATNLRGRPFRRV